MSDVPRTLEFLSIRDLDHHPRLRGLDPEFRRGMRVVAEVFPFRANTYVVEELIDWDRVPDDPIFRLTFPHPDMLPEEEFARLEAALDGPSDELAAIVHDIRVRARPHPAGQLTHNVPLMDGHPVPGVQHKYRETVLVFPSHGQTCHAYCTFCFRWPQFVGMGLRFATDRQCGFLEYLRRHPDVSDVLLTGGDPMIMRADRLAAYVDPLLEPGLEHIQTIRIGTKSVAYWPHRYLSDPDAEEILRLFERVVASGKHLALMGHYTHPRELSTRAARGAVRRIRGTGAEIRTQAPLVRCVNDDPTTWVRLWKEQVRLGCIPYYMFVARPTGASRTFAVPLYRAWRIYRGAFQRLSGLGRTARGPVMSAWPGKVLVEGVSEVAGERVFVLSMIQSRVPDQVRRPFFARFDPEALWLDELVPAFGRSRFPYEPEEEDTGAERIVAPVP